MSLTSSPPRPWPRSVRGGSGGRRGARPPWLAAGSRLTGHAEGPPGRAAPTPAGLRNWYVNFEHPTTRTTDGFDTFDLAVDLVIAPDLQRWEWKDEDEYAHARRLGIISDQEHQAVDAARTQILAMLREQSGPFADVASWTSWRWQPAWPAPRLPHPRPSGSHTTPSSSSCNGGAVGTDCQRRTQEAELSWHQPPGGRPIS
ncbi:DUF402 domain-containing protein [Streptomyces sp. NPDC059122]|uniref:DUF402 domain-containing protein n=1 Tax=Streptomyces sp. NPDC059122 TaxID=3346732 RepID=UPI00367565C9